MKRAEYFNFIEERLAVLANRIDSRGKLNFLDYHGHAEYFYRDLLNKLYGWTVENQNDIQQNVEAIDLIDHRNKLVLQVSSTASKQKIEASLSKDSIQSYQEKGYTFKFVSIARDANDLRRKKYENPHGIVFDPATDIIDRTSILSRLKSLEISDLARMYHFVKRELKPPIELEKTESNIAKVIHILSKENWDKKEPISEEIGFSIDRKIELNQLPNSKYWIDEYRVFHTRIDEIYTTCDLEGVNKSKTVLSAFKKEYLKEKDKSSGDDLFNRILDRMIDSVQNSSNYQPIPIEELEECIRILTVDAFIRCKIFQNPEDYPYAAS
jgi:hypothetical protein